MGPGAALLLLAVVALPFNGFWPDFEVARRGLMLVCAGALAVLAPKWLPRPLPRGSLVLGCLCAWMFGRTIGATNAMEGVYRSAHWVALWLVFVFGSGLTSRSAWSSIVPVTFVVAAFGLMQASGLSLPIAFAPSEPVSTLGNRNVASEVTAIGIAAAAALAFRVGSNVMAAAVAAVALVGASYLHANGSRSGLVALGIVFGIAVLQALRREQRTRAVLVAIALLTGFLASWLAFESTAASPDGGAAVPRVVKPSDDPEEAARTERPTPSTVAIRLAMWRACATMIGDAPLFGHGTGQFRYEYPRYRTPEEIELSTFGRQFATFAATAHDDPLEIAVETGLPGLCAFLVFLVVVCGPRLRSLRGLAETAPVLVFVWLSLVRSPVGNAPAAAFAFLCLGALARREPRPARARRGSAPSWIGAIVAGLALVFLGSKLWFGQSHAAEHLRALSFDSPNDAALDRAVAWHGSESRFRSLRIRWRRLRDGDIAAWAASTDDLTTLAQLDPNNVTALLLTAELANRAGNEVAARAALAQIGKLDPREPQAALLAAVMDAAAGNVPQAIARLYARPHPRLRERLATLLNELSKIEPLQDDPQGAALLIREAAFIRALDAVLADATATTTDQLVARAQRMLREDPRTRVLRARILQANGATDEAAKLAPERLDLSRSFRWLLRDVLEELRTIPQWRDA